MSLAPSIVYSRSRSRGTNLFLSVALILTKENLFAPSNVYNVHILLRLGKIMRNKASRPENMKNEYDENMSKSTALPDMNTTCDITSPLNSVPGPGCRFPPKVNFGSKKEHFLFSIFKNKFRHDYKPV